MSSNSDTGLPAHPKIVVYTYPEQNAIFNALTASRAETRAARDSAMTACSQCFKRDKTDGIGLRKCAKRKSVFYCSKECQKANWSVHKNQCRDVERGITKLITAFLANPILHGYLAVCLSLYFDLVNKPAPDTPFMARVDVALEPSELPVYWSLYAGRYGSAEPEKIEGMLQINAIRGTPPDITPYPHRLAAWREARERLRADGQASNPAVIVEFITNGAKGAFASVIPIPSIALSIAKEKQPFEKRSAITGDSSIPMTVESCLECINGFIRADKRNQLLLRMDMREEDRETIRGAARGDDTEPVRILREKMAREGVYLLYEKVDAV